MKRHQTAETRISASWCGFFATHAHPKIQLQAGKSKTDIRANCAYWDALRYFLYHHGGIYADMGHRMPEAARDWNDQVHNRLFREPMMRDGKLLDRQTILPYFSQFLTVSYWAHSWEPPKGDLPLNG